MLEDRVKHLQAILSGETTIGYHLEFLIRNNRADLLILKNTKVLCGIKYFQCMYSSARVVFTNCQRVALVSHFTCMRNPYSVRVSIAMGKCVCM